MIKGILFYNTGNNVGNFVYTEHPTEEDIQEKLKEITQKFPEDTSKKSIKIEKITPIKEEDTADPWGRAHTLDISMRFPGYSFKAGNICGIYLGISPDIKHIIYNSKKNEIRVFYYLHSFLSYIINDSQLFKAEYDDTTYKKLAYINKIMNDLYANKGSILNYEGDSTVVIHLINNNAVEEFSSSNTVDVVSQYDLLVDKFMYRFLAKIYDDTLLKLMKELYIISKDSMTNDIIMHGSTLHRVVINFYDRLYKEREKIRCPEDIKEMIGEEKVKDLIRYLQGRMAGKGYLYDCEFNAACLNKNIVLNMRSFKERSDMSAVFLRAYTWGDYGRFLDAAEKYFEDQERAFC